MLIDRRIGTAIYAAVYAGSVVAFTLAAHPALLVDYFRIAALAATVVIVLWTLEVAVIHTLNWRTHPRPHGQPPSRVWGMGIAFLLALSSTVRDVADLFGTPLRASALPILIATLVFSTYWLWPLRRSLYEQRRCLSRGR